MSIFLTGVVRRNTVKRLLTKPQVLYGRVHAEAEAVSRGGCDVVVESMYTPLSGIKE